MRTKVALLAGVVALAWSVTGCTLPMGDLGGSWSAAMAISDSGIVVGNAAASGSSGTDEVSRGFRRQPDGTITQLDPLPGQNVAEVDDVNDAGVAVGRSFLEPLNAGSPCPSLNVNRAVLWTEDGSPVDLGALDGGCNSRAMAIDDAGRVIGWSSTASGRSRAFVYDPEVGHLVGLPDLPGATSSNAFAMNDSGSAVGRQYVAPTWQSVLWDLDAGTVEVIRTGLDQITDINDAGVIAGATPYTGSGTSRVRQAAVWFPGDVGATTIGVQGRAMAVDEQGVAVGYTEANVAPPLPPTRAPKAFRWDPATGWVDLAPGKVAAVADINDRGDMVGASDQRAVFFFVDAEPS